MKSRLNQVRNNQITNLFGVQERLLENESNEKTL